MDKETLIEILNKKFVRLAFIKKDGTKREMFCTRYIKTLQDNPKRYDYVEPTGKGLSYDITKTDYIVVWDIEKCGWRTINAATTEIISSDYVDLFEEIKKIL